MDPHQTQHRKRNKTELDKLLGDEGTVKLLLNNPILTPQTRDSPNIIDSTSIKSIEELKRSVMRRAANDSDNNDEINFGGGGGLGVRAGSLRGTSARKGSSEI